MKEPGPAWLELGVAILLDESTSCRFDKYKDPLMSFAQKLWNMVNRASKDHRGGMYRKRLPDIQNAGFSLSVSFLRNIHLILNGKLL